MDEAQQYDSELSLLMIDVDHFKLFTHLRPSEGDVCLSRLGETLAGIARRTMGLPALWRRGILSVAAEHRCEAGWDREMVRAASLDLAMRIARQTIRPSPSASAWPAPCPNDTQRPGDLIEAADAALYAAKHRAATPWSSTALCG